MADGIGLNIVANSDLGSDLDSGLSIVLLKIATEPAPRKSDANISKPTPTGVEPPAKARALASNKSERKDKDTGKNKEKGKGKKHAVSNANNPSPAKIPQASPPLLQVADRSTSASQRRTAKPQTSAPAHRPALNDTPRQTAQQTVAVTPSATPAHSVKRPAPGALFASVAAPDTNKGATQAGAPSKAADSAGNASLKALKRDAFVQLLHAAIDRHKRYPRMARRQRREGIATILFRLHPDGGLDGLELDASSGFVALDKAALRAVAAVAPFTPAAKFLTRKTHFRVGVTFNLY